MLSLLGRGFERDRVKFVISYANTGLPSERFWQSVELDGKSLEYLLGLGFDSLGL